MNDYPTNSDDIIDFRDILTRIKDLQESRANDPDCFGETDQAELTSLEGLFEQGKGSSGWLYGETLIRDSYFEEYARDFAEDCCKMPTNIQWPYPRTDWSEAAEQLKMDYMSVDFDGVEYWIKA